MTRNSQIDPIFRGLVNSFSFPVEGTKLTPLRERINICPGFGQDEECGDEIPMDADFCKTHQREQDEYYHRKMQEAEGVEPLIAYPHLTDEGEL